MAINERVLQQMRHLDLLAVLLLRYPEAAAARLGRLSRDGLLDWEMAQREAESASWQEEKEGAAV